MAEALVEYGATVIVSSSNPQRVEKTISRLQEAYPSAKSRISGHACNLGDEDTLEPNIVELLDKVGKLDHIVHTAGDALATLSIDQIDVAKMKKAGMVRFFSPLLVAKHAPKYLTGGPNSSITLTTGAVSERPTPGWSMIGSFATGLQGMCRGLALDLKPIRVNLVSPGAVNTELWDNFGLTEEQKQQLMEHHKTGMPTGKVGLPEEVAEAYLYLIKDTNITGSMISTNGGVLLLGPR